MKLNVRAFTCDRAFAREALAVMLPVALQQVLSALFNVVDNVMVGSLDAISMTAVTVANKPNMIYMGVIFGVSGGAGILLSQFFGAGDIKQCQRIFAFEFIVAACWSTLCALLLCLFPESVMRLFVGDAATIALGVKYLRIAALSYIPAALSLACVFSMRPLGLNRLPMRICILTVALNAFFNYALIFGRFGMPRMGVEGAALGTLLARVAEAAIYIFILARKSAFFSLDVRCAFKLPRTVLKSLLRRALPLTGNEILFSLGFTVFFWCYARIDEAALPALTIAEQASQLGMVISSGLASSISVLVGTKLGAGDFEGAKRDAAKLFTVSLGVAGVCLAAGAILAFALPPFFHISAELKALATKLTMVYALAMPLSVSYCYAFFLLRAGGDTRSATLLDSVYMWLVPIPVCLAMTLLFPDSASLLGALCLTQILLATRLIPSAIFVKRGKWVKNITVES